MTPEKKLSKAKINLMLDQPFFGRILLELLLIRDDTQPTGYTDGKVLGYNHDFIDGMNLEGVMFFMVHEALHVALMHHTRRGARDHKKFNIAADHVINLTCEESNLKLAIPDDVYKDPQYREMSTEAVYLKLPQDPEDEGEGVGEVRDMPGDPTAAQKSLEEQRVKIAVTQALQQAKAVGKMPGGLERVIDELLDPVVPWHELLRDFVSEKARDDYSWSRPNRRFSGMDVIMPGLYSERMGKVCVAVDTSGSLSQDDLTRVASEIQGVLDDFPTASCKVIYCDYEVHADATEEFDPGDEIELHPKGGGGTRFKPVFEYIEAQEDDPIVLLYMTDLYGSLAGIDAPDYPVIWGLVEGANHKNEVPFGEVCSLCP